MSSGTDFQGEALHGYKIAYYRMMADHLTEGGTKSREKLCDYARQNLGQWGERAVARLAAIEADDPSAWAEVLVEAETYGNREKLQDLSPFMGQLLLFLNYGKDFLQLGNPEQVLSSAVRNKGMVPFNGNKYLLIVPPEVIKMLTVVKIR